MASLRSRHTQRTSNVVVKVVASAPNESTVAEWSLGAPAAEVTAPAGEQIPTTVMMPMMSDELPQPNFSHESTPVVEPASAIVETASQSDAERWASNKQAAALSPKQDAFQFQLPQKQKRSHNSDQTDYEIRPGQNGGFMISSNIAGLLIGVNGENFKAITKATGARMIVDNTTPGVFKQLNFVGQPNQVAEAKKKIREWVETEKAKRGFGGMNGTARQSEFKPADADFPPLGNKSALVNSQVSYADAASRPNGVNANSPDKTPVRPSCTTPPGFEKEKVKDIWSRQSPYENGGYVSAPNSSLPPAYNHNPKSGAGLTTSYVPSSTPSVPSLLVEASPPPVLQQPSTVSAATQPSSSSMSDLSMKFVCSVTMLEQDYQKRLEQANEKIICLEKQVGEMRDRMTEAHEFHLKNSICIECQSAPREVLFDCAHFTHCGRCSERIDRCPNCLSPVSVGGRKKVLK